MAQSCLTLCDPVDCSLPGSSVHGILQARTLEWVAISFSRGSSWPRIEPGYPALQADALTSEPPGKPPNTALDIINIYIDHIGLLSAQMVKNPSMQEIHAPSLGQKIPWRRECQPTPVFLPGEVHGQRSLTGYNPWGWKESDMTEQLTLSSWLLSFWCSMKLCV